MRIIRGRLLYEDYSREAFIRGLFEGGFYTMIIRGRRPQRVYKRRKRPWRGEYFKFASF